MSRRWYEYARGLRQHFTAGELGAVHAARSSRYLYARIALLPRVLGERLDQLGAPLQVFQFVAYGRAGGPGVPWELVRETRWRAVLQFFEDAGRWPHTFELPEIRRSTEERLGLRSPESDKERERDVEATRAQGDKSADRDEAETQAPELTVAAIQAAFDGKDPMLLRTLERFAHLRRQTEGR
jgi:hypothetical protein